jgi:hypothetical protein
LDAPRVVHRHRLRVDLVLCPWRLESLRTAAVVVVAVVVARSGCGASA